MEENIKVNKRMNTPKVSIIVPVYKTEKFLRRCLDSIINQTLEDIEIIVINDGSPDGAPVICDEYAEKDDRVQVIHQANGGVSSARNAGLDVCTGEYIGFVDSDDYISKNMYMELYSKAKEIDADMVNCDIIRNHDDYIIKTKIKKDVVYDKSMIDDLLISSNTSKVLWFSVRNIFKRDLIDIHRIRFTETNIIEDPIFNLNVLLCCDRIYSIDSALYHYINNPDSSMMSKGQKNLLDRVNNLYSEKIDIYDKYERNELKQNLYNYTVSHTIVMLLSNLLSSKNKMSDIISRLKEKRNTEMISTSFDNYDVIENVTYKLRIMIYLLKYRQYFALASMIKVYTSRLDASVE